MRSMALLSLLLALAGCTTAPAVPATRVPDVALVAVPAPCNPPVVPLKPHLPYSDLPAAATDGETIDSLLQSLKLCGEYSEKLQTILKEGFKK